MNERTGKTLADHFADFRAICADEGYELDVGERRNRKDSFAASRARDVEGGRPGQEGLSELSSPAAR